MSGQQDWCAAVPLPQRDERSNPTSRRLFTAPIEPRGGARHRIACGLPAFTLMLGMVQAASVHSLDGKSFQGELHFNQAGALIVKSAKNGTATIPLTNIAHATFTSGPFFSSGSVLPNGWAVQDIGETRGFVRVEEDAFIFRVTGQSTNAHACHFVSRPMHSDGGIVARIDEVAGDKEARAGIMIRSGSSAFVALSCGRDGRIHFDRAESARKEMRRTLLATIAAPIWLRLQKREKNITAMFSHDGRSWHTVTDSVKLPAEKSWREGDGDLRLLRASFGMFASSRGKGTACTARIARVGMSLHGLLGEYFSGREFEELKFSRIDPQVRFKWGVHSPDPSLSRDDYSVRWTGKLVPHKTGAYLFHFDGGERARLWIDKEEIRPVSFKRPEKRADVPAIDLTAGRAVDVKMEVLDGNVPESVRLGWSLGGHAPQVIGMTNFVFSFRATNSPERTRMLSMANEARVPGLLLRDGSFMAGAVVSADESAITMSVGDGKDVSVLNSRVARIVLQPPPQALRENAVSGRPGLLLRNGDFFESDLRAIERGIVQMSSVLFGLKRFGIEGGEPIAVILSECLPVNTPYEVRLSDASVLRASRISANEHTLTVDEPLLGQLSIPTSDLFKIARIDQPTDPAKAGGTPR